MLGVAAAALLALESVAFVWVHLKYNEVMPVVMSVVLGIAMAFVDYGGLLLKPIL